MRDADFDKDIRPDFAIDGYKLVCTCSACPEQYDVFNDNNKLVGYLRLRHGQFRADCPDVGGTTVYSSRPRKPWLRLKNTGNSFYSTLTSNLSVKPSNYC
ncbi:hypothetical protein EBZ39_02295 [bacterium]|nr:hypothetical protein [bacterium]